MNIFDFVNAAKALTTDEEVVALVDKFIAEQGPVSLAELRGGLEEVISGRLICDDKVYLTHMGNFVRQVKHTSTIQTSKNENPGKKRMNIVDFIKDLADVEGNEATQKFVMDFWEQASDEDRAAIVLGIDQMQGHLRKVVKSFWGFCGIHITGNWVSIDGVSYAINPHQHVKSLNVDFEGVMPGVDQMLYDQANTKALAQAAAVDPTGVLPVSPKMLPVSNLADQPELDTPPPQHKFHLTDAHGGCGVICKVIPDDQMPLDKEGNRAEIVINDSPCFKLPKTLVGPHSLWNSMSGKEAPEGFNVTVPTLMEGDVYHRTHVTSDNYVLHIAHDPAGNQAIYVCTQNGANIMREVIMKDYELLTERNFAPVTAMYADCLAGRFSTKTSN